MRNLSKEEIAQLAVIEYPEACCSTLVIRDYGATADGLLDSPPLEDVIATLVEQGKIIQQQEEGMEVKNKELGRLLADNRMLRGTNTIVYNNNSDLWAALNLIRAEVEEHGPVPSGEHVDPTPQAEAELIVRAVATLAVGRDICHGTCKDELDGKPLPGNWHDGTDGACPGWWRGQDNGVDGATKQLQKVLDGGEHTGHFGHEGMEKLASDILNLQSDYESKR